MVFVHAVAPEREANSAIASHVIQITGENGERIILILGTARDVMQKGIERKILNDSDKSRNGLTVSSETR
jgi:hypothetical protein